MNWISWQEFFSLPEFSNYLAEELTDDEILKLMETYRMIEREVDFEVNFVVDKKYIEYYVDRLIEEVD